MDLEKLDQALAVRAGFRIKYTRGMMKASKEPEVEKINSIYSQDIVAMAQAHIMFVAFKIFRETIDKIKCPNTRLHLNNLARLYALH